MSPHDKRKTVRGIAGLVEGASVVRSVAENQRRPLSATRYNTGSLGEGGFATGTLDGKVWRWEGVFPADKGMRFRFLWTETSPDSYTGRVEFSQDGKAFVTVAEGTATRVR